jgi:hypothetical protein
MKILHLPSAQREVTAQELLFHDEQLTKKWDKALESINKEYNDKVRDLKFNYLLINITYLCIGLVIGIFIC